LLDDGSTPFRIKRRENGEVFWTDQWWNSSLPPGEYYLSGDIHSEAPHLQLLMGCGKGYTITISEEEYEMGNIINTNRSNILNQKIF
jgi:hypothetical protein